MHCKVKKDYTNSKYKSMYIVLSKEWAIMDILLKKPEANLMYSSIYNTSSVSDYQLTIHP